MFSDKNASISFSNKKLHYRLKEIDIDAGFTYSPVRMVSVDQDFATIEVYLNPAP